MVFKRRVKKIARRTFKAGRRGIKARYHPKGYPDMKNIISDLKMLKTLVNAEKKNITNATAGALVGQVNGNLNAIHVATITPAPAQGNGDSQRSGDSIKLSTGIFNFQFIQQANTSSPVKLIVEVVRILGMPQTNAQFISQYTKFNPFVGDGVTVHDYFSNYDQDYASQYKVIARKVIVVRPDKVSGQKQITSLKMFLKFGRFGQHVKYAENSTTVASGEIKLVIRADNGNLSDVSASTLTGIANGAVSTGLTYNRNFTYYYYDN